MTRVLFTGIGGVGKSTIAEALTEQEEDLDYLCYGDVLFEYGKDNYDVEEREELDEVITTEDIQACDEKFLQEVYERSKDACLLIEARGTSSTPYGRRFDPFADIDEIDPEGIVMVEADPSQVKSRRDEDNKGRDQVSERELEIHQSMTRTEAINYGTDLGVPVYYVDNSGKLEESIEDVENLLEDIREL